MSFLPVAPRGGGIYPCFQEWAGFGEEDRHRAARRQLRQRRGGVNWAECSGLAAGVLSVLSVLGDHVQPGHSLFTPLYCWAAALANMFAWLQPWYNMTL